MILLEPSSPILEGEDDGVGRWFLAALLVRIIVFARLRSLGRQEACRAARSVVTQTELEMNATFDINCTAPESNTIRYGIFDGQKPEGSRPA